MFKRYQVLLPLWFEDYIKYVAEKYDISFTEVIRLEMCFAFISTAVQLYPDYKPELTIKDVFVRLKKYTQGKTEREDFLKLSSEVYFEARKAMEFRFKKERKGKK